MPWLSRLAIVLPLQDSCQSGFLSLISSCDSSKFIYPHLAVTEIRLQCAANLQERSALFKYFHNFGEDEGVSLFEHVFIYAWYIYGAIPFNMKLPAIFG